MAVLRYTNPVYDGYMADPFVMQVEGEYYAIGTGGPVHEGRQVDGRYYPVLRSADLVHWAYLGGALEPLEHADMHYWAPEAAQRNGRFYLYYSVGAASGEGHKIRVAISDRPQGPYRDAGKVLLPDEPFSIDPHAFMDPADGRWYLFFARDYFDEPVGTGAAVVPLAEDMVSVAGPVTTVLRAQGDWQIYQRNRHWYGRTWAKWHTVEGPFVLYREGRYYCFYSGGCWEKPEYGVGFAVADRVTGPYVDTQDKAGPVVLCGVPGKVFGPGHNSVIRGPGDRDWMVYHAWDAAWQKRMMCIDPLRWTPEGPRCDGPSAEPREVEELY